MSAMRFPPYINLLHALNLTIKMEGEADSWTGDPAGIWALLWVHSGLFNTIVNKYGCMVHHYGKVLD